jgi:cytochrome c oxidase subunit 2
MTFPIFPAQASTTAAQVDHLYFFLTAFSVLICAIIFLPLIFFAFRYRRGHRADRSPLRISTMKLEVTWTVIPLFIAMGMFAWGARVYFDIEVLPQDAMQINVVGKQWMWKLQHPEGNREIDELHVPVGRNVKLVMASEDVIHSFFVPEFRVKQDVVPGRFVTAWFKATRAGEFHIFCSQYCGKDHSRMIGTVHVMEPNAYQEWLHKGATGDTLAQSGEKLFRELGCSGCHAGNGTVRAPRLEGIYGKPTPLQSGEVVIADDKYIRDSILLPNAQVAAGYAPVMPTFQGRITEEDLFQLIAYIKSIGDKQPEEVR